MGAGTPDSRADRRQRAAEQRRFPQHVKARRGPTAVPRGLALRKRRLRRPACVDRPPGCSALTLHRTGGDHPHPDDGFVDVEFRQGSAVVARGSVSTGVALTVEVPLGGTRIHADGVKVGAVDEGVATDRAAPSPAREGVTYLRSGEDCPDNAPL